jgi:signal transduction histidine kinase
LIITLSDDGRGFENTASTVQKISELSGRGIGMSAVKSAVEKLGGSIEVLSVPGRGTTFHFNLPGNDNLADIVPDLIKHFSDAEQV